MISHHISRYIYRDIISHIMRYHKIRYIEILVSYPYPEILGLISRYRIPSKYSSIPKTIFCPPLGAPSLVHQDTLYARTHTTWYAGRHFSFFSCSTLILQNQVQVLQVCDNCSNYSIGCIAPSNSGSTGYTAIS